MDLIGLNTLCRDLTDTELLARARVTLAQFQAAVSLGRYDKERQLRSELEVLRPHLFKRLHRLVQEETVAQLVAGDAGELEWQLRHGELDVGGA